MFGQVQTSHSVAPRHSGSALGRPFHVIFPSCSSLFNQHNEQSHCRAFPPRDSCRGRGRSLRTVVAIVTRSLSLSIKVFNLPSPVNVSAPNACSLLYLRFNTLKLLKLDNALFSKLAILFQPKYSSSSFSRPVNVSDLSSLTSFSDSRNSLKFTIPSNVPPSIALILFFQALKTKRFPNPRNMLAFNTDNTLLDIHNSLRVFSPSKAPLLMLTI